MIILLLIVRDFNSLQFEVICTFPAFLYTLLLSCSAVSGGLAPAVSPTDADWHPSNAGPDNTSRNDSSNTDVIGIGGFHVIIVFNARY